MDKIQFKKILDGFNEDGTHPDYPLQKVYNVEELSRRGGSNPMFDLPALVVYEQDEYGKISHIGVVFALGNSVDGVRIHVMSEYEGKVKCHPIEESPSGKRPAYLLTKRHVTMKNVP